MIIYKDTMEIKAQSKTPNTNGFQPTAFNLEKDNPEPIKNKVNTSKAFDNSVMPPVSKGGIVKKLLAVMASMNNPINQGMGIRFDFDLKTKVLATATGIIHKALANFTVVARFKASFP